MQTQTRHPLRRLAALLLGALLLTGSLTGCAVLEEIAVGVLEGAQTESPSASPSMKNTAEDDYYTITGPAERPYEPSREGLVEYCPLDERDRAVCAYGELTPELRDQAQERGRQDISVDPAGWPERNDEIEIPALPAVEGSRPYSGWFWNRSHLVADSLGGDPSAENLVAGTRTQNVGSTQTNGQDAGGMAHTEVIARDYLDNPASRDCPLYYAATPEYLEDELIPRTVVVDVRSCDGAIDERVRVFNSAMGFDIDYSDGTYEQTV